VKSSFAARLSTAVGAVIAIAGGVFVVHSIAGHWDVVRSSLHNGSLAWLLAGFVCAAFAMLSMAVVWRVALGLVGVNVDLGATVVWYFVGEIGKYVPGGIWPVVGRAELARRKGLPRAACYASVALSLGALYLAAMLVVAVLLPIRFLGQHGAGALWVLLLLPVGIGILHPRPLAWFVARGERVLKRPIAVRIPPWRASLALVIRYVPAWLLVGTATWCTARAFEPNISWMAVAPPAILSWVVGFVLVPVPGGVGVREATFTALVTGMPSAVAATVAIVARVTFMLVDAGGAALMAANLRRVAPLPSRQ
jgi:uncharacterized membrane protein YbhN (UPF0104 family)